MVPPAGVEKITWSPVTKRCGVSKLMVSVSRSIDSADDTKAAPICIDVVLPTGMITPYWRPVSRPPTLVVRPCAL